eukprot:497516-Pleurochrysis_carterae.AAC.2
MQRVSAARRGAVSVSVRTAMSTVAHTVAIAGQWSVRSTSPRSPRMAHSRSNASFPVALSTGQLPLTAMAPALLIGYTKTFDTNNDGDVEDAAARSEGALAATDCAFVGTSTLLAGKGEAMGLEVMVRFSASVVAAGRAAVATVVRRGRDGGCASPPLVSVVGCA